jgi:hypothetical protein
MDPQSAAHLIRILRTIAIELRLSNDIAMRDVAYPNSHTTLPQTIATARADYREEMS